MSVKFVQKIRLQKKFRMAENGRMDADLEVLNFHRQAFAPELATGNGQLATHRLANE